MKAYVLNEKNGLDDLKLTEIPAPTPGPSEVLLKMKAATLNYRDLMIAKGPYPPPLLSQLIPLSDGVGEVTAVGADVTRFKIGDRVCPIFMPNWIAGPPNPGRLSEALGGSVNGVLAEQMVVSDYSLVHAPLHLTDEEAASLPCAAVTAWHALVVNGGIKPGDTVLLLGTGGVSIFGLQFAKLAGARVIITSGSDEKLARTKELGADDGINYKTTPDWDKAVKELTDNVGASHVLEVGGQETFPKSVSAAALGGHVAVIGGVSGFAGQVESSSVLRKSMRIQGVYVGSRDMFEAMNQAITVSKLKPVVDKTFAFDDARAAYEMLESGSHFGKVAIRF